MSLVSLNVQNTVNSVYNNTIFTMKVSLPNFSIHSHVNIVIGSDHLNKLRSVIKQRCWSLIVTHLQYCYLFRKDHLPIKLTTKQCLILRARAPQPLKCLHTVFKCALFYN